MNKRWNTYEQMPEEFKKAITYTDVANLAYQLGRKEEQAEQHSQYMLSNSGQIGISGGPVVAGLNMTSRAGRVLMNAAREAEYLEHKYIGTEHLLLGLTNPPESVAANVLRLLGVTAPALRTATMHFLNNGESGISADSTNKAAAVSVLLPAWQPSDLKFRDLRKANMARLSLFRNKRGELVHKNADGSDWSLSDWSNAMHGETGEAANIIKKVRRGDLTLEEARPLLADELADAQTYLDILAFRSGVDMYQALLKKWNEVSDRVECKIYLDDVSRAAAGQPAPVLPQELMCTCGHEMQYHRSGADGNACDNLDCKCMCFDPKEKAKADLTEADMLKQLDEIKNSPAAMAWLKGGAEKPVRLTLAFTSELMTTVKVAHSMAVDAKSEEVDTLHMLLTLAAHSDGLLAMTLHKFDVPVRKFTQLLMEKLGEEACANLGQAAVAKKKAKAEPVAASLASKLDDMLREVPWAQRKGEPVDEVAKLKRLLAAARPCVIDTVLTKEIDKALGITQDDKPKESAT